MSPFIRRSSVRHTDRVLARSVLFLVLAVYLATASGLPDNPEGEVEFQATSALARTGTYAIGGTPEAEEIVKAAQASEPDASAAVLGRDQRYYTRSGVALTLVGVPFYAAGRLASFFWPGLQSDHANKTRYGAPSSEYFEHLAVGLRNPFFGALTAWLIVLAARRIGATRLQAWIAGMTYGLTTFAWAQSRSSLSDVQATFFLLYAFHLTLHVRESYDRLDPARWQVLIGLGLAIGLALLTSTAVAPACFVLFVGAQAVLWNGCRRINESAWSPRGRVEAKGWRVVLFSSAPVVLAVLALLVTNWQRFGHALDTGIGSPYFQAPLLEGAFGLLVSPGRGILWMAPALLLLPWGIQAARARSERLWLGVLAFLVLAVGLPPASIRSWHGDWSYGPRYLLPLLPFLWLGVALALGPLSEGTWKRLACVGLLGLGLLVQVPAALVDPMTHRDLAVQAARAEWPLVDAEFPPGSPELEAELFERIQWDWGFAAPWSHWRILRHRVAGLDEVYSAHEIFRAPSGVSVSPSRGREEGFRHLAWIDLEERLGGALWPAAVVILASFVAGVMLSFRGLDHAAP